MRSVGAPMNAQAIRLADALRTRTSTIVNEADRLRDGLTLIIQNALRVCVWRRSCRCVDLFAAH